MSRFAALYARLRARTRDDAGSISIEWALVVVAGVTAASLLVKVMSLPAVQDAMSRIILRALA